MYRDDSGEERLGAGQAVVEIEGQEGVGQTGEEWEVDGRVGGQDDTRSFALSQRQAVMEGRGEALVLDAEMQQGIVKAAVDNGKVWPGGVMDGELLAVAEGIGTGGCEGDAVGIDAAVKPERYLAVFRNHSGAQKKGVGSGGDAGMGGAAQVERGFTDPQTVVEDEREGVGVRPERRHRGVAEQAVGFPIEGIEG